MIPGVSFQPATGNMSPVDQDRARASGGGVQEAIKILSLRLPKVVGAQALAPSALLTSEGSGGNPRVDSVISQVMQRIFPTGANPSGVTAPVLPTGTSGSYGPAPTQGGYDAPRFDMPFSQAPVMDGASRKPLPRITPGYQPPRTDDPLFETPIPINPAPSPAPPLPSQDVIDWPTRYEI